MDRDLPEPAPPRCSAGIGSKAIGLAERTQNNERLQWSAPSQQTRWQLMDPRRPNAGSMDRTMSRPAGYDRRLEIWQNEAKMLKVFNGRRCWSRVEEMAERSLWTAADPMRGRMHRTTSRPAGYDRRHQIWQNEAKIVNVFNGRAVADVSGRVGVRGGGRAALGKEPHAPPWPTG
jgi:hypothetical protein